MRLLALETGPTNNELGEVRTDASARVRIASARLAACESGASRSTGNPPPLGDNAARPPGVLTTAEAMIPPASAALAPASAIESVVLAVCPRPGTHAVVPRKNPPGPLPTERNRSPASAKERSAPAASPATRAERAFWRSSRAERRARLTDSALSKAPTSRSRTTATTTTPSVRIARRFPRGRGSDGGSSGGSIAMGCASLAVAVSDIWHEPGRPGHPGGSKEKTDPEGPALSRCSGGLSQAALAMSPVLPVSALIHWCKISP